MTEPDLSHNRALAMRAKLSITDSRAQRFVERWLLRNRVNQDSINRNARMVATCAEISGTNIQEVGNWDALAHCLIASILCEEQGWVQQQTYLFDLNRWTSTERVFADVFGDRFVGNVYVERFAVDGSALMVTRSPI